VLNFNPYNILAGIIFGTIGFGAWRYGRTLDLWKPTVIGLVLMVYPYLVSIDWLLWGIGVALLILLWFQHDE
jgi:ACR3 family arsenite efflux pump ArsB